MLYEVKENAGSKLGVITIPAFGSRIYVVCGPTAKSWEKHADFIFTDIGPGYDRWKACYLESANEEYPANGVCVMSGKCPIILLHKEQLTARTLVHECVHAVQSIEHGCDIKDVEFTAYMVSHIYCAAYAFLTEALGLAVAKDRVSL